MIYIKRFFVELLRNLTTNIRYAAGSGRANLGCGLHALPGWENIEGSPFIWMAKLKLYRLAYELSGMKSHYSYSEYTSKMQDLKIKYFDLRNGAPFRDESMKYLYTAHFLEHLTKEDAEYFLLDCFRALRSGGLLRVGVPDLDVAMTQFKQGDEEEVLKRFFYNADFRDFSSHKYNYNFNTMYRVLAKIGYVEISRKAFQIGSVPDCEKLDTYPDYSLYVECKKP